MTNRLSDACARELESYIKNLFETAPRIPGRLAVEVPVIGGLFWPDTDYSPLLLRVCRALAPASDFTRRLQGGPSCR